MSTSHITNDSRYSVTTHDIPPNMQDNLIVGNEARDKILLGFSKVANAVAQTIGSAGRNAILHDQLTPGHVLTNDGVSVARKIKLADPFEDLGAGLAREIADKAEKDSGDGTSTTLVLTNAILQEGIKATESPMEVMRSLNDCLPLIEESIRAQTKQITVDEVAAVAGIAAESPEMGSTLQAIYQKVGKDGLVEIEPSGSFQTSYEITNGVRLRNCGYIHPIMANVGNKAVYKNPKILVTKEKITEKRAIELYEKMKAMQVTDLVIFFNEMDDSAILGYAALKERGQFNPLLIKAPTLFKDWLFEDFAKITGAKLIEPISGLTLKNLKGEHLGTCDKIITTREDTIVFGIQEISGHIAALRDSNIPDVQVRIAWLNTNAATLKLGANSESELSYKMRKLEDARNSAYLALQNGIVVGGGVTLIHAMDSLPETVGGTILKAALSAPMRQIMKNAGNGASWLPGTKPFLGFDWSDKNTGFDSSDGTCKDLVAAGIVDPTTTVLNAVKNAISIAGVILTTNVAVIEHK